MVTLLPAFIAVTELANVKTTVLDENVTESTFALPTAVPSIFTINCAFPVPMFAAVNGTLYSRAINRTPVTCFETRAGGTLLITDWGAKLGATPPPSVARNLFCTDKSAVYDSVIVSVASKLLLLIVIVTTFEDICTLEIEPILIEN